MVKWRYDWAPEAGTPEARLYSDSCGRATGPTGPVSRARRRLTRAHAHRPFGGSFDPGACGALVALARLALDELALDRLHWMPAGQPWQKERPMTPAVHRVAMLQLAMAGEPRRARPPRGRPPGLSTPSTASRELQANTPAPWLFLLIGRTSTPPSTPGRNGPELLDRDIWPVGGGGQRPGQRPRRRRSRWGAPRLAAAAARRVGHRHPPARGARGPADRPSGAARGGGAIFRTGLRAPPQELNGHPQAAARHRRWPEDVKAQNIAVFNTEHLSPLFERVIIARHQQPADQGTGRQRARDRQVPRPAGDAHRRRGQRRVDHRRLRRRGVAHIMQPAIRDYYHLEEIWGGKAVKLKMGEKGTGGWPRPASRWT